LTETETLQDQTQLTVDVERFLGLKKSSATTRVAQSAIRYFESYLQAKASDFNLFLEAAYDDLEKPIRQQTKFTENEISLFCDYLSKGLSTRTVRLYAMAVVSLLDYKSIKVYTKWIRFPASRPVKENAKHAWTLPQIWRFAKLAPTPRLKAVIGCLFQSGLSISDLCNLNYGSIKAEYEAGTLPICLTVTRQKTGIGFRTFIGKDALYYLSRYLASRTDQPLKPDSPLFTLNGDKQRLTPGATEKDFHALLEKVTFLDEGEGKGWNPVRCHSLRAAFSSQLRNHVSDQIVEYFMGHSIGQVQSAYLNLPTERLRKIYHEKAEPHLTFRNPQPNPAPKPSLQGAPAGPKGRSEEARKR
jgi:integrase